MEHNKTWRWRRKSSEKMVFANARASVSHESNVYEDQDKDLRSPRCSNNVAERLAIKTCDCAAKEELIRKHVKMAEIAFAGQQMAEAEATFLKQELDKALKQGEAAEQRLAQLDATLKDCMHEIEALGVEQDGKIHEAFSKATEDFEKMQKKLEGKLAESNKRISTLTAENSNLMKALLCKEKLIEDIDRGKGHLEAEFDMLMARSDVMEKENTLLKYECGVMEEELKLRNEEIDHSRRSALETAKHFNRLEAECQQLNNLVRKRVQGNSPKKPSKDVSLLVKRVYDLEGENKALREIVSLSDSELESWRIKCGRMDSRLAEVEGQFREISEGERSNKQLAISNVGINNDCQVDDFGTWASSLLEELERFKKGDINKELNCQVFDKRAAHDSNEIDKFALVTTSAIAQGAGSNNSWLDEVLKVILEEQRVSKRSFSDILLDIKIVLGCKDDLPKQNDENGTNISGLLPWKEDPTLQGSPRNGISVQEAGNNVTNASFARYKIRKHLGFDRSRSENQLDIASNHHNTLAQMIKIQSCLQEENRTTKEKLQLVTEENLALKKQLDESNQGLESLKREVDTLRETKLVMEEQVENQRLISEDLDTQLTVAKAKLNEIMHKVSSLEIELEDKNNCCEELEATCLEVQLQLEILSRKESPSRDIDQVAKKLKTEMIQNLGKQLSALNSPDTILFDKVICPKTTITTSKVPTSDIKSISAQRSSLRDRMIAEDKNETDDPQVSRSQDKQSDTNLPMLAPVPELKVTSSEQVGNLALVPSKRLSGGFGFIRKLFWRRKKGCNKMKSVPLQRNTSALIGPKDVLLVT